MNFQLVQSVNLPLPYDSCDRLRQTPATLIAGGSGDGWMDGWP